MIVLRLPIDPAEELPIRRFIRPKPIPNKGKGVYAFDSLDVPLLVENGWEFVGNHGRKRFRAYLRSPGAVAANAFPIDGKIPTDDAILRFADAMIRLATGPRDHLNILGRLGPYWATFQPHGQLMCQWLPDHPFTEEERIKDRSPTLTVSARLTNWRTTLRWLEGYGKTPDWDRDDYFSELRGGSP